MLILRRKVGEKIVIGDGITVVVNRVSGGRVTLGIDAPNDVHIVRGELRPFGAEAALPSGGIPVLAGIAHDEPLGRSLSEPPRQPR